MSTLTLCLLIGCILPLLLYSRRRRLTPPLPPGPPAEPLIGHTRIFPAVHQVDVFTKWAAEYGNIFYLKVLGKPIVVLNSFQTVTDLLEKRSAIYSDRADCTTYSLMGLASVTALSRYGAQWRRQRRMLQEPLLAKSCIAHQDMQLREVGLMLKNILTSSENSGLAIERLAAGIMMELAYGHEVLSNDDEYIKIGEDATHAVEAGAAGTSLLDLLPILQHIPPWIPGCSSFTAAVRKWRPAVSRLYDVPFDAVLAQMNAGTARRSYTSSHLERCTQAGDLSDENIHDIKITAATLLIGGFDTTWSNLLSFVYAMLLFPDAQRKAREEIDRVVGSERLPDFSDRADLPYIECVLQEVARWHPVFPLGIAHRTIQDDIYDGMFIPKGSLVIPNVTAINRDEKIYRDPDRFYPDRFLPEPAGYGETHFSTAFGFGRRICPGRHLADGTAWLAMTNILAVFEITNAVGANGEKIVPDIAFRETITRWATTSLLNVLTSYSRSQPEPYKCVMVPRSEKAKALILAQSH
ncbi:cytochrome P450 [Sparassis latifolia]